MDVCTLFVELLSVCLYSVCGVAVCLSVFVVTFLTEITIILSCDVCYAISCSTYHCPHSVCLSLCLSMNL